MPRTVTVVPFGLRLFTWLTESFGRLAVPIVDVGAPLPALEFEALVAVDFATLVVLTTALVVVALEATGATVVATAVGATVDAPSVAVSKVVVTNVSVVA